MVYLDFIKINNNKISFEKLAKMFIGRFELLHLVSKERIT